MFGFFRPYESGLRNIEISTFRGYYCRICYNLWRIGGQKARFATTFDCTLFDIVLALAGQDEKQFFEGCHRLDKRFIKKFESDEVGGLIAKLSLLIILFKVEDDIQDENSKTALLLKSVFKKEFNQVKSEFPQIYQLINTGFKKIDELQANNADAVEVIDLFGNIIHDMFASFFQIDEKYLHVLYAIARWNFFVDMLVDYDDDYKENKPNSFKRTEYKTLEELFNHEYNYLYPLIKQENRALRDAVAAVKDDSVEYIVLSKMINHATETVISDILNKKDVTFHYVKYTCGNIIQSRKELKYEKSYVNPQSNKSL